VLRIVFNILFFLCMFFPATAKAQLFLEDGKVVLSVSPGDRVNKSLTVSNTSAEELHVKIYWEDFQYQPPYDGTKKFFPAGVGPASASKWVTYSPSEITLPPYGKQRIDYSISIPNQLDVGYYGVLFFERTGATIKDVSGLDIITRVGCLFFIEPKDAVRKASIEKVSVNGSKITGDFVNESAITLIPRMVYYITEEGGMVKDRGELKKIYVPAKATASWELPIPAGLEAGRYSIVINVDLGNESVSTQEFTLIKDASGQASLEMAQTP
jgi:hypothetical protein